MPPVVPILDLLTKNTVFCQLLSVTYTKMTVESKGYLKVRCN